MEDSIYQQYVALSHLDPQTALLRLDMRCSKEIATLLQSGDPASILQAMEVLDRPFKPEDDIMTMEEKTVVYWHLEQMFNIRGSYRYNVYSNGSRNLPDEVQTEIREEGRKSESRLQELATLIYNTFKSATASHVQQKRKSIKAARSAVRETIKEL